MKKKVIVGLSGGVDSSVAALLLKQKGYEVIGITFKFTEDFDVADAKKVAEKIKIEHYIVDYTNEFKNLVIDKFINDYKKGITPNPCVLCNRYVKFKFLYDQMKKYDCKFIATGHYAKVIDGVLYMGKDKNKDQTYFLCELTKDELNSLLLPLEGLEKSYVRDIARSNDLIVADKKDSYDICFINNTFKEYISSIIKDKPGDIIDIKTNKVLKKHDGLKKYTIGQRKGLDIGGTENKMFVVKKDIDNNILYVSDDEKYLFSNSCIIDNFNWTYDKRINNLKARFRYRQELIDVSLEYISEDQIKVNYNNVKSVTEGQVCALYYNDICVGGGIIRKVFKNI